MKVTIFTSNQPRHTSLINSIASVADDVYAVQECCTIFPGQVDDFYKKSEVMQTYFNHVMAAEKHVFGLPSFSRKNVRHIALKMGDINNVGMDMLKPALDSDIYIIFGSSYIKGSLCDHLLKNKAINIHMGTSPYYRGSSCNFWALQDGNPDYVGATIHMLSKGLDSGDMLFHALPSPQKVDGFQLGMCAVKAAHEGLVEFIRSGAQYSVQETIKQDKSQEIRYTRHADFTDQVAQEYLANMLSKDNICEKLQQRDLSQFLNPFLGG